MTDLSRRLLLRRAAQLAAVTVGTQLAAASCGAGPLVSSGSASRILRGYPFTLGVASGDPVADGFVIWTRLAPNPFDPLDITADAIEVIWEIASDAEMKAIVKSGTAVARRGLGHAVHVEARGLPAGRPFWYRFRIPGGDASPVGRTWTAPLLSAKLAQMRIAYTSCQHFEQGYFTAYDHMVRDNPDLILHLGDYIYESSWGEQVRRHDGPEPVSLTEYRARHALYKTDSSLQRAHAHCPWLLTWDDHEVDNDYAAFESEDYQDKDAFVKRRAAAYQAYFEHLPLRAVALPRASEMRLYQRSTFGDLAEIAMLDNRQYRSPQACRTPEKGGAQVVINDQCAELLDPNRQLLGKDQERWLTRGFGRSKALWNIVAHASLFARLNQRKDGQPATWTDDWNGYPVVRDRVLSQMQTSKLSNPIIIGGDIHSFWVNDVQADWRDPTSPVVASEFVSSSISSAGPNFEQFSAMLQENPHVKFFDSRIRGYALATLTPKTYRTDLRTIDDVRNPQTKASTLGAWIVENGKPGPQKA